MTKGQADTPGFPISTEPTIEVDHKHSKKLRMIRNHNRINQTSIDLLQCWRANCDVQILIYDCHPDKPSVSDIARVTDYIVGYACKGNTTSVDEKEHLKQMILA